MTRIMVVFAALISVIGCVPAQSNSGAASSSAAAVDTLIGVVTEVGADPSTWMSLRPTGGGQSLRLTGDGATALRAVGRTEVWVSGARQLEEFRVDAFEVRKANDVAVDDGTVSVEQGKVWLTTRAGTRREISYAPPELRSMSGARIWITRPVENQAPTYGVIRRP